MAHTRATKGRPKPPSRNIIARVVPKRGSTVESLRVSINSIEEDENEAEDTPIPQSRRQSPSARGGLRDIDEEEGSMVNIKQKNDDMVEVTEVATPPKKRNQEPVPKASATKRYKTSPSSSSTRTTRSKTMTYKAKLDSIHSNIDTDTESECDLNPHHTTMTNAGSRHKNAKMTLINPSLDLLRPYMAFQLSVSGLSGKAYKAAQASMASVLDVAECLEQESGGTFVRAYDNPSSSSEEREMKMGRGKGAARTEKEVKKLERRTEEDALPRKQGELNEQTRKRLERQRSRRRNDQSRDRDSVSLQLFMQFPRYLFDTDISRPLIPLPSLLPSMQQQR